MMTIETNGLTKKFRGHAAVLDLELQVPQGSAFALIGANGAGKTTTLKMLLDIVHPDAGSATVLGKDSRRLKPADLARIGYVAENQQLPKGLSVEAFFDYIRPMYPKWDRAIETRLRSEMRLPAKTAIGNLSHGARMKLALACALPFRPELLILDEPLSGLDPLARDEFMEGMLQQADETTVLVSSHELAEIEGSLTHVAFLDQGRLQFSETLADLNSRFREVRVTLPEGEAPPGTPSMPESWRGLHAEGNAVHFVETQFEESSLGDRVRGVLGAVRSIQAERMGLRSIFVALARASQQQQGGAL